MDWRRTIASRCWQSRRADGIDPTGFFGKLALSVAAALLFVDPGKAQTAPITVVAAENFYGDVARQLSGSNVQVIDILSNPATDPHLFEASPSTARAISSADLVIYNGLNYDPWAAKLVSTSNKSPRRIIVVAALLQKNSPGINPHIWYDPATMPAVASRVALDLEEIDPPHKPGYQERVRQFLVSVRQIDAKIASMRERYQGLAVTATEPVFAYMTAAIGLEMLNQRFQMATMNDTEPSASDTAQFERTLRTAGVRVLIYNRQASNTAIERLIRIARQSKVPVVGVTETMPAGVTYQQWVLGELDSLDHALSGSGS